MEIQRKLIRKKMNEADEDLKTKIKENWSKFTFAKLIDSIDIFIKEDLKKGRQKRSLTEQEIKNINLIKEIKFKTLKTKKNKALLKKQIKLKYYLINKLRTEDNSWQNIVNYLKKFHNIDCSIQYLINCYKEIKEDLSSH